MNTRNSSDISLRNDTLFNFFLLLFLILKKFLSLITICLILQVKDRFHVVGMDVVNDLQDLTNWQDIRGRIRARRILHVQCAIKNL